MREHGRRGQRIGRTVIAVVSVIARDDIYVFSTMSFARRTLRGSTALQALALLGAGIGMLATAAPAAAQDYNQVNATGRVQGTNGEPVAGAVVSVTSNDQGFTRTATTGTDGSFRISALPQGTYTFKIEATGFQSFTDGSVSLNQGQSANQFTLAPEGASADVDIVVTAGRVQVVDFDRNTTGAVINIGDLATRVPVARDITSVVLLSPGTAAGDTAFGNLPSINGASVSENAYYVNGLNITQFRNGLSGAQVPFEFYQTVEVKNGGLSAEYGRITGGFVNSTTKSGSNEFHGGVTFNWEPDDLRDDPPNTYAQDYDSSYSDRHDFIAQLSGPIIKDHLFFYGIYNARDVRTGSGYTAVSSTTTTGASACSSNPTTCEAFGNLAAANQALAGNQYIQDKNTSPFWGGKIDAVIVDGQRLEATYFNTSNVTTRNTYGTANFTLASGQRYNPNTNDPGAYRSSTVFRLGGENYVFRYTGTFTDWLTLSGAYGVNKNRDTTESSLPLYPSIVDQRNGGNASIGNTTSNNTLQFDKRTFYRADGDVNFKLLGSHHIRGGYDREDLDESSNIVANSGFQYTLATASTGDETGLPAGTSYVKQRTFVSGGAFTSKNEAYYLQDSWQLLDNRLSLNLGIRNDRFVSKNADGQTFYTSGDQWGPRLGFSLDPQGSGRSRIYGSFSRYFLPVAVNTNVRLAGSELDFDAYYRLSGLNPDNTPILGAAITNVAGGVACPSGTPAGNACIVRNDGSVPSTGSTVASNLNSQSLDEYILGAEQRLGTRMRIGAYFTYTNLNDSLEDAALDQAIVPYCIAQGNTEQACRALYPGVSQYALINPGRDVTVELGNGLPNNPNATTVVNLSAAALQYPKAARQYRAMTFTFDRDFDGKWDLHASYTYSKLVGNIEGGVRSDNGQTDAGLTTAFDLPGLVDGNYGYLPNDRRHNFKIYGSYQIGDWLTLGANGVIVSQRRFGCLGRVPAQRDFNNTSTGRGGLAGQYYSAAGYYCNVDASGNVISNPVGFTLVNDSLPVSGSTAAVRPSTLQLTPRGRSFKSDWLYNINLDASIKVPTDAFDGFIRVSIFNVFNIKQKLDFNETGTVAAGTPNSTYGYVTSYQSPRYVRLQFGVNF
jgi:hypothetical protein